MNEIILFFILQLGNVVLSTIRQILTVKAGRKTKVLVNTAYYTFYTVIVKMIANGDLLTVCLVTCATNFIGVWLADLILDKTSKTKLWVVNATVTKDIKNTIDLLETAKIEYVYVPLKENLYTIQIFNYTKEDTKFTRQILEKDNIKYYIIESK